MTHEGIVDTATSILEEEGDYEVGRIQVIDGPDAGLEHSFVGRTLTIGSGPTAELRLRDPTVSRLHAELTREASGVRLRDLGSKNGCFIAGVRVVEVVLVPGARVRIGSTTVEARVSRERLRKLAWRGGDHFGAVLGASAAMHDLFALSGRVAQTDERILLRGESGTGKELLARAIHDHSARAQGPFVVLDCGALSNRLADVELFGHARGAFTGAEVDRPGVFERAHGGTVFLDEIADLPLELQPKLLRALERGEVQRLGEGVPRTVDVRVIASTRQHLEQRVNEGTFREDLLFRIAVVTIDVPPLRERGRDVYLLASAIADDLRPTDPTTRDLIEREVTARAGYPWPGNVRELRSFVRRVAFLGPGGGDMAGAEPMGTPSVRVDMPFHDAKKDWITAFERQYVSQLLDACSGNVSEAARRAGLNRAYLHEMIERLKLPK